MFYQMILYMPWNLVKIIKNIETLILFSKLLRIKQNSLEYGVSIDIRAILEVVAKE